ncbi:MAG: mannose-1-phosphate guanylyltransferase [Lentisphaeria bacterium]
MDSKRVAVIMAGGSGERFWPLSRKDRPKQLLNLTRPDKSLLQEAIERVAPAVGYENVFVATGEHLVEAIRNAQLGIPADNVLAEPCKRNTAGCLCYVTAVLLARHNMDVANISMAVLTADHQIGDEEEFQNTVTTSLEVAEQNDALVTIGIRPTRAETGYGYIEMDNTAKPADGSSSEYPVFPVVRFLEKPDRETAQRFLATGHYLWNSGMFFWGVKTFQNELRDARPEMVDIIEQIAAAMVENKLDEAREAFSRLPDISIDYALMERAKGLLVAPASFKWDDVGSWDALDRTFDHDAQDNVVIGDPVLHETEKSIIYNEAGAEKMAVSVVGMQDVVVVVSSDSVLVVPKKRAQDVKAAVKELKKRNARQL